MSIGGTGNPANTGRMFITLKPRDQRAANADQIIARLRPQLDKVEGAKLFLQRRRTCASADASARTQYSTRCRIPTSTSSTHGRRSCSRRCRPCRSCATSPSDQETDGTTLTLTFDRDQASRYGLTAQTIDDTLYDAFGQRQIAQYFTQLFKLRSDHGGVAELAERSRRRSTRSS